MLELPEVTVIARQVVETLGGKRIARATAGASPHKFAMYSGDPATYNERLAGRTVGAAQGVATAVEIELGDMAVAVSAPLHYHAPGAKLPTKHQLLLEFDDGSAVSSSALMWGAFLCYPTTTVDFPLDIGPGKQHPSPLTAAFDRAYFETLLTEETPPYSAKEFLAAHQRIPGLGNGVLQDILWTARIHPKRKMAALSAAELDAMYAAVKGVLAQMTAQGGRDTERDLFWQPGGYRTILSRNTVGAPCPACGTPIAKQAFLGGAIYFCETCQPL